MKRKQINNKLIIIDRKINTTDTEGVLGDNRIDINDERRLKKFTDNEENY